MYHACLTLIELFCGVRESGGLTCNELSNPCSLMQRELNTGIPDRLPAVAVHEVIARRGLGRVRRAACLNLPHS